MRHLKKKEQKIEPPPPSAGAQKDQMELHPPPQLKTAVQKHQFVVLGRTSITFLYIHIQNGADIFSMSPNRSKKKVSKILMKIRPKDGQI